MSLLPLAPMRPALPGSLDEGGAAPVAGAVVVLLEAPELLVPPCEPGEPLAPIDWVSEALPAVPPLPAWFWLPAPMELLPPGLACVEESEPGAWFGVAEGVGVSGLEGLADVVLLLDSLRCVVEDDPAPGLDDSPWARAAPARVRVRSPASVGRRTERKGIDAFISGTP